MLSNPESQMSESFNRRIRKLSGSRRLNNFLVQTYKMLEVN